jgi:hypothetical protein
MCKSPSPHGNTPVLTTHLLTEYLHDLVEYERHGGKPTPQGRQGNPEYKSGELEEPILGEKKGPNPKGVSARRPTRDRTRRISLTDVSGRSARGSCLESTSPVRAVIRMTRMGWIPQPNSPTARSAMLASRQLCSDVRPKDTAAWPMMPTMIAWSPANAETTAAR